MYRQLKIFIASIALLLPLAGPAQAISGGIPGSPFDPHVSSRTASAITIEWDAPLLNPVFVTRYEVRYSSDEGETWSTFNESNKTDTQAVIDTFVQGDQYLVSVASVGTGGQSSWVSVRASEKVLYAAVGSGQRHTCAVTLIGEVKCWGNNAYGQLGDGTGTNSTIPVSVQGINNAVSVSAGENHSCAVLDTGKIKCWGYNFNGSLGDGSFSGSNSPVTVKEITNATSVALGYTHTCATLTSGEVKCWGGNGEGQLGNGTRNSSQTPTLVSGISNASAVSASYATTCALLETQEIKCWGSNESGQLGDGTTTWRLAPVLVQGISNATDVSLGNFHTCAALSTGQLKCWGANAYGQIGDATNINRLSPTLVQDISNATNVSIGVNYSCSLLTTGEIKCWGDNSYGKLGNGSSENRSTPVKVIGLSNATSLSSGGGHTCALLQSKELKCWGEPWSGEIGNGSIITNGSSLVHWPQTQVIQISSGDLTTCATLATGEVNCWGLNSRGLLDNGTKFLSTTPLPISGINNATAVSVGGDHVCSLLATREIKCWGDNLSGQLGDGTTTENSKTPVSVVGINSAIALSSGFSNSCALLSTGGIKCWGLNDMGQLGNGTTNSSNSPVSVEGINNATAIAVGQYHVCALLATKEIKCWGNKIYNFIGQQLVTSPVLVQDINNATAISVGRSHICAVLETGAVKCWGSNNIGQLGDGSKITSDTPVSVQGVTTATSITTGYEHTCALLASGESKCWGRNDNGQLGNDSESNSTTPTAVKDITQATAISAGTLHTCAIINTGEIACWGYNAYGQLGDGKDSRALVPTRVITFPKSFIKLPMAPTPPSEITFDAQTSTGLRINWAADSFGDGLDIDNYSLETSTDSQTWTSYDTTQLSKTFTGLLTASAICVRVRAHSAAGWGEYTEDVCSQTTGTRTMRFSFEKESGETVSGGSVQWRLSDNTYVGAQALGVTSNGVLEFPRVAAGLGTITASNLVMGDGTLVSGSWKLSLGYATHTLRVPEAPSVAQRTVRVVLPNGLPVAGTMVSVNVTSQITSDEFTFRASTPKVGGTTDANGEFVAVGYSNGNPTATISYNDGVLIQNKTVTLTSDVTVVTLEEMPWLELASSSTTAVENALVPIAVNVGAVAPLAAYRALGMDPFAMSGISVSVVPPKGSVQKCAKKVLSAKTNASGKATLKVCATKSGVYTIKGRGAAATGAFTLKVKGAAPMPVTSLSGITPAASTAKIAWNAPTYTGGAPVKNYTVTIVGGGKTFKKVVTTRTVTFTGLKRATVYTATVVATTKNGTSDKATTSVSVA